MAVLLIGPYTFLPSVLEYAVARDVQARLGLDKSPDVDLESDPALGMLAGKFSDGNISLKGVKFGGVRPESATIDLDPFDVDVVKSIREGSISVREPLSGRLRVAIPEAEVSRLAAANSDVPVQGVDIKKDRVVVNSEAEMLGTTVPANATGDFGLSGERLIFEPRSLEAAGVPVPDELADQLLAGTGFEYPLRGLPYGATITGAETEDGRLVLKGDVPRVPLGVYPGG